VVDDQPKEKIKKKSKEQVEDEPKHDDDVVVDDQPKEKIKKKSKETVEDESKQHDDVVVDDQPKEKIKKKSKEISNESFNPDNFIEINGYDLIMYKKKYYLRDLETNQLYDIQNNSPNKFIGIYTINGKVKLN
jgi:hypothetical protein